MFYKKSMHMLCLCLVCLSLAMPAAATEKAIEQVIAKVVSVTPGAWLERLGQKMLVTQGMELLRVDALSTDAQGAVKVEFAEKTTAALSPNTRLQLESFDLRPDSADLHLRMAAGSARVISGGITKLRPNALKVFTPMATIGIRGTDCAMTATPVQTTLVVNSIGEKDIQVTNMLTLEESNLTKPGQVIVVTPEGNILRMVTEAEKKSGMPQ